MKQNSRIQRETVLSIVAAAIAVPLIAVPAAAGLGGGRFFVKAWNVEDPSIMAIAGYGGIGHGGQIPGGSGGTGPGGGSTDPGDGTTPGGGNGGTGPGGGTGGSNPGGGSGSTPQPGEPGSGSGADSGSSADSSAVLNSFAFGGLQLKITQNMVDFSKANEQLIAQGRGAETVCTLKAGRSSPLPMARVHPHWAGSLEPQATTSLKPIAETPWHLPKRWWRLRGTTAISG